jgi:hypothetical protein
VTDLEGLVDTACARAGSTDLGGDTWREGLEVLLRSLASDAHLNEIGVGVMTDRIVGFLVNRLEVEQWYARHPEIDDQEVVAPVFGLGLPRTGSTALSFLLSQDPTHRSLRTWEADRPCPPPETATEHTDPRIAATQAGIDLTNALFPDFVGLLPTAADGPQECLLLFGLDFRTQLFDGMVRVPTYVEWLLACDMEPVYRYHRRVLKLLQWRCPPTRWWLKTPSHMLSMDALDAVYPDARFVMTHRDVGQVLPSVCALYHALSSVLTDRPDPVAIGTANLAVWRVAVERLLEFRDRGNEHRFVDLSFDAVQRNPIAEIKRLYAALGEHLSPDASTAMQAWWSANAVDRAPSAPHAPGEFGLHAADIATAFAAYHRRFGIAGGGLPADSG